MRKKNWARSHHAAKLDRRIRAYLLRHAEHVKEIQLEWEKWSPPSGRAPDTELVLRWLEGYEGTDERGLPVHLYPTGEEALKAKLALRSLLFGNAPFDRRMRNALAAKLDLPLCRPPPFDEFKRSYLVGQIWKKRRSGGSIERAVGEITDENGVSERTIWRAWSRHRDQFKFITGS